MQMTHEYDQVVKALAAVQMKLPRIIKTAFNPHTKSRYVDLASLWETIRPLLLEAGLIILQPTRWGQKGPVIETWVIHVDSGQYLASELEIPVDDWKTPMTDPQRVGAAITYARRYALTTFLGLAGEDDDGNLGGVSNGREELPSRGGEPERKKASPPAGTRPEKGSMRPATDKQVAMLRGRLTQKGKTEADLRQAFNLKPQEPFYMDQMDDYLKWISGAGTAPPQQEAPMEDF